MQFKELVSHIELIHQKTKQAVTSAINQGLSIRNWLVGYYIVEFEQEGAERSTYGERLLPSIAKSIKIKGFSASDLSRYRQFYLTYPNILATVSQEYIQELNENSILATVSQELKNSENKALLTKLSFSHFRELIKIDDDLKRSFYESECISGTWSVRELQRQINSLYYERSALSRDKKGLSKSENKTAERQQNILKDFYVFEFLDLPHKNMISESQLEASLLDNVQDVILELGNGFCFEARQKRILIGEDYYFIDLVFYHRILKCHILIELKVDEFNHHNAGQLNTYIEYYNDKIKQKDDNPTIGLLLVTNKNETLVKYATASMENKMFVKKYLVELPTVEEIEQELKKYLDEQ